MITIDIARLADALAERLQLDQRSPWISTIQAAEYLGVSERWLRDRLDEIPHRRIDGKILFHRSELDAWTELYRPH